MEVPGCDKAGVEPVDPIRYTEKSLVGCLEGQGLLGLHMP